MNERILPHKCRVLSITQLMRAILQSLVRVCADDLHAVQLKFCHLFYGGFSFLVRYVTVIGFYQIAAREAVRSPELRGSQCVRWAELCFFVALWT